MTVKKKMNFPYFQKTSVNPQTIFSKARFDLGCSYSTKKGTDQKPVPFLIFL